MAEQFSFFNSVRVNGIGDRVYKAEDFARYFRKFIKNGYFPETETSLKLVENEGMTTILKSGAAYINGYMYENTSDLIVSHDIADGVLNRIDRIVIQLSYQDRTIRAKVKKGVPASSPTAPGLQRDADVYELGIADVYIGAGVTSLSQANITDQRGNAALCGTVNNLFAMQSVNASAVLVNDANQNYDSINLEGVLDEIKRPLNVYRSGLDLNTNVFTIVEWKRPSGTLFKKAVLSNPVNSNYTVQTITFYATDGLTVLKTETWDITYDSNGNVVNEVKR